MVARASWILPCRMVHARRRTRLADSQAGLTVVLHPHDAARTADDHRRTFARALAPTRLVSVGIARQLARGKWPPCEAATNRRALERDDAPALRLATPRIHALG